jgi:hypothetical protein
VLHVGQEEAPRLADRLADVVGADVRAPDDAGPGPPQRRHEHGGLGILEHHDVTGGDERGRLDGRRPPDPLEQRPIRESRMPVGLAVQHVVEALGEAEERRRSGEHEPAGVDAGGTPVGPERALHLGDAASERGRVDAPDRAPAEQRAPLLTRPLE